MIDLLLDPLLIFLLSFVLLGLFFFIVHFPSSIFFCVRSIHPILPRIAPSVRTTHNTRACRRSSAATGKARERAPSEVRLSNNNAWYFSSYRGSKSSHSLIRPINFILRAVAHFPKALLLSVLLLAHFSSQFSIHLSEFHRDQIHSLFSPVPPFFCSGFHVTYCFSYTRLRMDDLNGIVPLFFRTACCKCPSWVQRISPSRFPSGEEIAGCLCVSIVRLLSVPFILFF